MGASSIGAAAGFVLGGPIGAGVGFIAGAQKENLDEVKKARRAQEKLEEDRRNTLRNEAAAREAAANKAATSGQRVGMGRAGVLGSHGFGSGNSAPGLGAGSLFGN